MSGEDRPRFRQGHPRTFGWLLIQRHPNGCETWESPEGEWRTFPAGRIVVSQIAEFPGPVRRRDG